jgi:hypothetical protein
LTLTSCPQLASVPARFALGIALFRSLNSKVVQLHIDAPSSESDTFSFEAQSLLDGGVSP